MFILFFIILWAAFGFPNFMEGVNISDPITWSDGYIFLLFMIVLQGIKAFLKRMK